MTGPVRPIGVGKAAGTMLGAVAAQMSDVDRFRRGRSYARAGAVEGIAVEAGIMAADIAGSRPMPYEVAVRVDPLSPQQRRRVRMFAEDDARRFAAMVPQADQMHCGCTCPDWEVPCKHVVAALVEFADDVSSDPDLLVRWRDAEHAGVAQPGEDREPEEPQAAVARRDTPADDAWARFLGEPVQIEAVAGALVEDIALQPVAPPVPGPADHPWVAAYAGALREFRRAMS